MTEWKAFWKHYLAYDNLEDLNSDGEDKFKGDLKEIEQERVYWIYLAQQRESGRAVSNTKVNVLES
jgi:hypothetical protein